MPTASRQWGSAMQWLNSPLPKGGVAVIAQVPLSRQRRPPGQTPRPPSSPVPLAGGLAHCGFLAPAAPRRCGNALQELHCPLPQGSGVLYRKRSTARCQHTLRWCIARAALPFAAEPCGSALRDFRSLGSDRRLGRTSRCPQLVGPRIAGVPLASAPRQCGSALQELNCPLPLGSAAVHRSSTAHCPHVVRRRITGVPLFRQRPPRGQDFSSP